MTAPPAADDRSVLDLRYPDGSQPEQATVKILRHEPSRRVYAPEDWTPHRPELKRRENVRALMTYAEVFRDTHRAQFPSRWISEEMEFPETAAWSEVIRVELMPRRVLSVRVVDGDGKPVENVSYDQP